MYIIIPGHRHFPNNENPVDIFENSLKMKFDTIHDACNWVSYITKARAVVLHKNNTDLMYIYSPFGLTLDGKGVYAEFGAIVDENELSDEFLEYYLTDDFMNDLVKEDKENHRSLGECKVDEASL